MYNLHRITYLMERNIDLKTAGNLLENELEVRKTPEVLAFHAYISALKDDFQDAYRILEDQVQGKTHEPSSLLLMAKTYKLLGDREKVEHLKKQLKDTRYELGPLTYREVMSL